jgi:hypothetical protein
MLRLRIRSDSASFPNTPSFLFYLFVVSLTTLSVAQIMWRRVMGCIMKWKGYAMKWSWPNLRHYPRICLEALRETRSKWNCMTIIVLCYTGVKLGLSPQGKRRDSACLITGRWGEYLDLRGMIWHDVWENYIIMSFIICTPHLILLEQWSEGEMRLVGYVARIGTWEIYKPFSTNTWRGETTWEIKG